ncbi:hypothetical protein GCM10027046_02630 [Uliginosibacterium flavum]|uniref:Uncharacterized protein n=1 Tax=Uliginosibacterium flavum TaxID=1396831 RepID=A0ABV2TIV5_9RHOO
MSTAWNLKELRTYIHSQRNADRLTLELIDSVNRNNSIFEYHMVTARDALKGILNYEEPQGVDNLMLILGCSDRREKFHCANVVSEANLISCIHTARSLLENFAQLVNRISLESSIDVADCTPQKVAAKLPNGELKTKFEELLSSHWFKYTSAFTNTIKHRQLVQHQVAISFVDNVVGIKIGAFEYRDTRYQACWANEFLQGVIDLKNGTIGLGQSLNRTL